MAFDWKSLVRTVAPGLATALGGPLAGMATQAVSNAILGKPDGTEEELSKALQGATPETLAAIKKADQEFSIKMKELDVDVIKISAGDVANARERDMAFLTAGRVNKRQDILAYLAVAVLAFEIALAIWMVVYTNLSDLKMQGIFALLNMAIGNQFKTVNDVYGFEFGSSQGSVASNKVLRKIAEGTDAAK